MEQQVGTRLQDQLMALNEIFVQGVAMMSQVQEESFANVQHTVEESTHKMVKGMLFDDKYETLEEIEEKVQKSLEVEEAYEAIDLSSSIELTYTSVIDSYVPFPQSLSYILFELEPREKSLYPNLHSKQILLTLTKDFHIKSSLRTTMIKIHM